MRRKEREAGPKRALICRECGVSYGNGERSGPIGRSVVRSQDAEMGKRSYHGPIVTSVFAGIGQERGE